eukprot:GHVN01012281.1.p1 GENE.GHVN01012281.1~~GHVN01012281.1.p1  ORF type:complete len:234 (+),score=31.96 GHVN01012281.1:225-926(+)
MASFFAGKAADSMFADVQRDWTASTQGTVLGQQPSPQGQPEIDWVDFNYPPLLRLFHFNLAELPDRMRSIVRWIHISFLVALLVMMINFIDVIILAALGLQNGWWNLIYSLLNFFIGAPLGCFVFYSGYKALAKNDSKIKFRYLIMQGVLIALYVVFALIPFGPFNGFIALALMGDGKLYHFASSGGSGFAIVVIIVESLGWLISAGIAGLCVWKTHKFNPYEEQESRTIGVR